MVTVDAKVFVCGGRRLVIISEGLKLDLTARGRYEYLVGNALTKSQ